MERQHAATLPLTPLQSGILFHARREPRGGMYVEQLTCRLDGALDTRAFAGAWQLLADRHDALRTAIVWRAGGQPAQVVHAQADLPVVIDDWSGMDPARVPAALAQLEAAERAEAFDFERPPLMRVRLVRLAEERHALIWTHHHIILDGWSVSLLVQDLIALYGALAAGRAPALAPAVSFEPFLHWLGRRDRGATLAYWRARLERVSTPTIVPPDTDEPAGGEIAQLRAELTAAEAAALDQAARLHGCTPFTIVAAAWALMLAMVTDSRDVLFGMTVSGRPCALPNVESMVGLFINTVPFTARIDPREPVTAWVRALEAQKQLAVDQHAHAPLTDVLRTLRQATQADTPASSAGWTPFNTLLVYENYPLPGSLDISATLALRDIHATERTNYDLTLLVVPSPGYAFTVAFAPNRHAPATVRQLMDGLRAALARLCAPDAADDRRVGDLFEAAGDERRRVLVDHAHGGPAHVPTDGAAIDAGPRLEQIIWDRFRADGPAAIAVSCGREQWSNGHLRQQASRVATWLRARGIGPEDRVGLCVRRGPWLMAGVLGILDAGAAYVPFDVTWPAARKQWVAADAAVKAVLIDEGGDAGAEGVPILALGTGLATHAAGAGDPAAPAKDDGSRADARRRSARQLAYVMYTSGSTGTPKGVMLEHAGLVNRLRWMQRAYPIGPRDRVLQKTPVTFDVSVWELFWPLMTGARLVFAEPERHRDSHYVAREIRRRRISTVHFVPPMLRALLDDPGLAACIARSSRSLRHVICSGEALPADVVRRFWSAARGAGAVAATGEAPETGIGLHNLYGPTEASVDVSAWTTMPEDRSAPIGRPIDGIRLYVLDRALRPLPAGAAGELCIGGVGLARGYQHGPAATAASFVPDPFSDAPGQRLYRTGDLTRWRADGALAYLGRLDHQVKIRGIRVEPGELEHMLLRHPDIAAAAVVATTRAETGTQLVAYVVRRDRRDTWRAARLALLDWLADRLPAHLMPAVIVERPDGLPLNAHGKVDRRALPPPPLAQAEEGDEGDGVRWAMLTPIERAVADTFLDVLGRASSPPLAPDDQFFRLGGDSLSILRASTRLSACFGVDVPVDRLWAAPSVRAMAQVIEGLLAPAGGRVPVMVSTEGDASRAAPLSRAQQRLWMTHHADPASAQHNVSCAVWLDGALDSSVLDAALVALVARHDVLRTEFLLEEGEPRQRVRDQVSSPLRVVDIDAPPDARERVCREQALARIRQPFDLRHAPLLRATLLRCAPERHLLVLAMHHIACDGWSSQILLRDLCALHEAASRGVEPRLPALPMRYADFARWQREWERTPDVRAHIEFWRGALRHAPVDHGLPAMTDAAADAAGRAAAITRVLPPPLVERLRAMRQTHGVTTFMQLLSAFGAALQDITGRTDVVIGADAADRAVHGSWELVGFFINQLALRLDLGGDPPFAELLDRVRRTCVEAYAHQRAPYDLLVQELRAQAGPERSLFRVKLVQQPPPVGEFSLTGLTVRPCAVSEPSPEFDLILNFTEEDCGLALEAEYRLDRFTAELIGHLLERIEHFLAAGASQPSARLSDLRALTRGAAHPADAPFARRRRVAVSPPAAALLHGESGSVS